MVAVIFLSLSTVILLGCTSSRISSSTPPSSHPPSHAYSRPHAGEAPAKGAESIEDTVALLEAAVLTVTGRRRGADGRSFGYSTSRENILCLNRTWAYGSVEEPLGPQLTRELLGRLRLHGVQIDVCQPVRVEDQTGVEIGVTFSKPQFMSAESAKLGLNLSGGKLDPNVKPPYGLPGSGLWAAGYHWVLKRMPRTGWTVVQVLDAWIS